MFQLTFAIITAALIAGSFRGTHEVLGHALVHRPMGDLRLLAGRPLGVGAGWHVQLVQSPRLSQRADFAGGTVVHVNSVQPA